MKMSSKDQDLTLQQRTERLLGRGAAAQSTPVAPKESTGEKMAKPESVDFDVDKVEQLLSILHDLRDTVAYQHIREAAIALLAQINRELWEQLHPEEAEAERAKSEEIQKQEKDRLTKEKEKAK